MESIPEFYVRQLEPAQWDEWNRFVLNQRDGSVFHTTHWLKHQQDRKLRVYGFYYKGKLCGGLSLALKDDYLFSYAAQPVMTPYFGPVLSDEAQSMVDMDTTARAVWSIARKYDAFRFSIPPQATLLSNFLHKEITPKDLRTNRLKNTDPDQLFDIYDSSLRRNIRKAVKNELTCHESDDFETIYALSAASYRANGRSHPLDKEVFLKLTAEMKELGLAKAYLVVDKEKRPHACCFAPRDARYGYNLIHGIDRELRNLQGGALALHTAVYDCMSDGLGFDFEGSMQDRIHQFYQKFGAEACTFTHFHRINSKMLAFWNKLRMYRV